MKLFEISNYLDTRGPLAFQEEYDNCGLLIGDKAMDIASVLVCLDCTEDVIDEAINNNHNLIISHHPLLFQGLKKITGANYVQKIVTKAIKYDIAIYAMHTNLDNIRGGVSFIFANKMGLLNTRILQKKSNILSKLVTYSPKKYLKKIQDRLFNIGAGKVGFKYDECSFLSQGNGTFRPLEGADPYVGKKNERTSQEEYRIELIFPSHLEGKVINTLFEAHPYEEVAYEIIALENKSSNIGSGIIGELHKEIDVLSFFELCKEKMPFSVLRHTKFLNKKIKKIAFCGGSGSFLIKEAINQCADIYISSDFKYHDFFDADGKIIIADIGHYETEQFVAEKISEIIKKKFPKLDVILTEINTNPISYY